MTYSLYIDQLVLKCWEDEIDPTDSFIISFIYDLNQDNPNIKNWMRDGYFLINRKWLLEQLPLLKLEGHALGVRLRKLKELGILDGKIYMTQKGKQSYFKLSEQFWQVHTEIHRAVDEIQAGKNPQGMQKSFAQESQKTYAQGMQKSHNESIKDESIKKEEEPVSKPSFDLAINENYEEKDSSSPFFSKSEKKSDTTDTENQESQPDFGIKDVYKNIVGIINESKPKWQPQLIYESVENTFEILDCTGKLDINYLLYVAKKDGETARAFHAALKGGWYLESWEAEGTERYINNPNTDLIIDMEREVAKVIYTREEWEAEFGGDYDEHDIKIEVCPVCGFVKTLTDYCDCGHVQEKSKWIYSDEMCAMLSSENTTREMLTNHPLSEYWQEMCQKIFPILWEELEEMVRNAEQKEIPGLVTV